MATLISGSTGVNKITDGTIVNADIASGAAIAGTKLVMPAGSVLQVVSSTLTSGNAISSSSNTFVNAGLSAAITPSASSSKILVMVDQNLSSGASGNWTGFGVFRGSTSIKSHSYVQRNGGSHMSTQVSYIKLDSPNTTNATTYKTMFKASTGTAQVNDNNAPATITLMEIAG